MVLTNFNLITRGTDVRRKININSFGYFAKFLEDFPIIQCTRNVYLQKTTIMHIDHREVYHTGSGIHIPYKHIRLKFTHNETTKS